MILFWTILIFASIAWYAFLMFYVGARAGRDIRNMVRNLRDRTDGERS